MSKVYVNVSVLPTLGCLMTNEGNLHHQEFDSLIVCATHYKTFCGLVVTMAI